MPFFGPGVNTIIIRIYHKYEGGIEKSVKWITVGLPSDEILRDGFFYSILTQIMDSISCFNTIKFTFLFFLKNAPRSS